MPRVLLLLGLCLVDVLPRIGGGSCPWHSPCGGERHRFLEARGSIREELILRHDLLRDTQGD